MKNSKEKVQSTKYKGQITEAAPLARFALCTLYFVFCTFALLPGSEARAQQNSPPPDRPTLYSDFGFAGKIPADRWAPITVWVSPGEKALGGSIVTEFDQDATQAARIITPFAATPGVQTPVQIVAALPAMVDRVTFTMLDDRGRRIARLRYSTLPGDEAALLPAAIGVDEGLLVCVGRTSLPEAVRVWRDIVEPQGQGQPTRPWASPSNPGSITLADTDRAWSTVRAAAVEPQTLPFSWIAWDGVTVLVADADSASAADPRAIDAVRTWVEGGGRLLVIAGVAGPQWRSWLPDGPAGDLVDLGDPVVTPLPEECADAMVAEAARDRTDALEGEKEAEEIKSRPPVPAPAVRVPMRPLRLTERARADGWCTRWRAGEHAALVEGPVGFGWVTIIGFEPRQAPSVLSARAAGAVWRDALRAPAAVWLEGRVMANPWGQPWWGRGESETQHAMVGLLNRLHGVPNLGDMIFFVIGGCMLALAFLVGPVDYFLLRRLGAGQHSWLSALAWIGLASAGAYTAPVLLRSGPTQVTRLTVVDRIADAPPADAPAAAPFAWQTGLTGIFAAQSGTATFAEPDQSGWWRGVSALAPMFRPGQERIIGTVTTTQDAAGGMLGASRGNPLERLSMGLWTFRTFMDHSRPVSAVSATVDRHEEGAGGWAVEVAGVPDGAVVADAALRIGDRWHDLGEYSLERSEGRLAWRVAAKDGRNRPPLAWHRAGWQEFSTDTQAMDRPGMAASLPGALERATSIDRRVAAGGWAAVYVHCRGWPPDAAVDLVSESRRSVVLRLLAPLDPADRVDPTPTRTVPRVDHAGTPSQGIPWPPSESDPANQP